MLVVILRTIVEENTQGRSLCQLIIETKNESFNTLFNITRELSENSPIKLNNRYMISHIKLINIRFNSFGHG